RVLPRHTLPPIHVGFTSPHQLTGTASAGYAYITRSSLTLCMCYHGADVAASQPPDASRRPSHRTYDGPALRPVTKGEWCIQAGLTDKSPKQQSFDYWPCHIAYFLMAVMLLCLVPHRRCGVHVCPLQWGRGTEREQGQYQVCGCSLSWLQVDMRFELQRQTWIPPEVKEEVLRAEKNRFTKEGVLVITSQKHRTQAQNIEDALDKLQAVLDAALDAVRPKEVDMDTVKRVKQNIKAGHERRLNDKKRESTRKKERSRRDFD
ncbi:hypothetical protein QJQ45_015259, partial [Haematococcus lacustris]